MIVFWDTCSDVILMMNMHVSCCDKTLLNTGRVDPLVEQLAILVILITVVKSNRPHWVELSTFEISHRIVDVNDLIISANKTILGHVI